MSSPNKSAFDQVPEWWFEPVVGLWVALGAVLGLELTFAGARQLLAPPDPVAWLGPFLAVLAAVFAYGVFAVGLTRVYRSARGFDPRLPPESLGGDEWRWVGGLGIAGLVVVGLIALWSHLVGYGADVAAPMLAVGSPPFVLGEFPVAFQFVAVNDVVTSAPYVAYVALFGGLLAGPATAALFHGVLQDALARAGSPVGTVVATAVAATIALETSAFVSMTTFHEAISAVAVFGFVLGAAFAYRETENLLVAMAAYGLFNALVVVLAWLSLVARLQAHGHLFG